VNAESGFEKHSLDKSSETVEAENVSMLQHSWGAIGFGNPFRAECRQIMAKMALIC
jgi:hypothetical protein